MTIDLDGFYHSGIIVEDVERKAQILTRDFGIAWSPLIDVDVRMWFRDHETRVIRARALYSTRHPHLELVEAVADTPMTIRPGQSIHHLGFWAPDLAAASAALEARGWPKILCPVDDRGEMFAVAYHELPDGMYVELVDPAAYADWEGFLAGRLTHAVQTPG